MAVATGPVAGSPGLTLHPPRWRWAGLTGRVAIVSAFISTTLLLLHRRVALVGDVHEVDPLALAGGQAGLWAGQMMG